MEIEVYEESGASWIRIHNDADFSLLLCDIGAGIYKMMLDEKDLVIAEKEKKEWFHTGRQYGKTIGRIAGRIKDGDLLFEGKHYALEKGKNGNTLHGGSAGYGYKKFDYSVLEKENIVQVTFEVHSPDGDGGFPGDVDTKVIYEIAKTEARFKIIYRSVSSLDTPLSLTSHCYFNLGGYKNVSNHSLFIASHESTKYDAEQIPLGFEKTPKDLDFSRLTPLKDRLDADALFKSATKGIDHAFLLDKARQECAILESPLFRMRLFTDYPTLVCYALNYPVLGTLLTTGYQEEAHSGFAMEPEFDIRNKEEMLCSKEKGQEKFIEYVFERK